MKIRMERSDDVQSVDHLIRSAFAHAEHCDGNEAELVRALRHSRSFIPELSLVADVEERIAGYILFTRVGIGDGTGLALAPLAVLPEYQRCGIGSALIGEGHRIAAALGYDYSVVLGSRAYYSHSGYRPAGEFGIQPPPGLPAENLMAIRLRGDAAPVSGTIVYAPEFGI